MAPSSAAEETLTPLADSLQQHPVTLLQRNSQPQEAKQKDHTLNHLSPTSTEHAFLSPPHFA